MAYTSGGKGTQPLSSKMKAMGRNLARASNQSGGGKGYAAGGAVKGVATGFGGKPAPLGGGKVRGTGAQTKGTTWKGAV